MEEAILTLNGRTVPVRWDSEGDGLASNLGGKPESPDSEKAAQNGFLPITRHLPQYESHCSISRSLRAAHTILSRLSTISARISEYFWLESCFE